MSSATLDRIESKVADSKIGLLGYVVWFGLPDVVIQPSQLATIAAGVDLKDTPSMGSTADAFRRATTTRTRRGENRTTRYLMRPVCDTGDSIVRHLIVEHVDTNGVKLGHAAATEVVFDKASRQMTWKTLDASLMTPEVQEIIAEANADFVEFTTSLTGNEIQRWVMRQLDRLSHISVHPNGAVYFVPASRGDDARKLQKFIHSLAPYAKTKSEVPTFRVIPIVDDVEQRASVKQDLSASVSKELNTLIGDIAELLNRPSKPDQATAEHRLGQVGHMMAKVNEYEKVLGESLAEIKTKVEIVQAQAESLLERAASTEDPLLALATKAGADVTFSDSRKSASLTNRLNPARSVSVKFNADGWSVSGSIKLRIEDLGARDEVTTHTDTWTARTSDPEVAMLFIRKALRLPAVA